MSAFALSGLRVDKIDGRRFADALEFFKGGKTLEVEDTIFVLDPDRGQLSVMKRASRRMESVGDDAASAEISRAIEVYDYLRENSPQFARIIAEFIPRFSVVHDYGTGSVEICHIHDGKLIWKT